MSRESVVKRPKAQPKADPKVLPQSITKPAAQSEPHKDPKPVPVASAPAPLTGDALLKMPAADYMNASQMEFFRARLADMKRQLIENADQTSDHLRENDVVPDPADRATIEEEHALELRTRDRERKLMKKIDQALARIDDGSYGYCEETDDAIGLPRLLARPTATMSVEAQQRRELKQKLYGE
jgi:DnaK suppressor protein